MLSPGWAWIGPLIARSLPPLPTSIMMPSPAELVRR